MDKKTKSQLFSVISIIGILIGFYLFYKFSLGIYGFIAALFLPNLFALLIVKLIPDKNTRKKNSPNKTISNKSTNKNIDSHKSLKTDKEILTLPLEQLTWNEFERLCYLYYKAKRYRPIETKKGADGGIDLVIYNRHHRQNVAIQIKHWIDSGNRVGVKEIRELDSAKKNYKCILAEFISSTGYTKDALIEADKRKIKCHTADKILKWREQEVIKKDLA